MPCKVMEELVVVYQIGCTASEVEGLSRDVAYEQSVELPPELIQSPHILENIVGRVACIEPVEGCVDLFRVEIRYAAALAGNQFPQLLNLLFGNISMKRNVRVVDVHFPPSVLAHFPGPRFGIEGIRQVLGVFDRPLLSTALKPQGASLAELAAMAGEFALGGGDIVKDDHNLHDATFAAFCERVNRCHEAVAAANARTGGNTLYFPNIMAPAEELDRQVEFVVSRGLPGILIAPFLMGPDQVRRICQKHPLIVMAHPTLTGAYFHDPRHGFDPGILLGTLFRLMGCDISIYPHVGGRFTFTQDDCLKIADELRKPHGSLLPAFPAPAGGMKFDTLPALCDVYGTDAVLLIGGALIGHAPSVREGTAAFLGQIQQKYPGRRIEPQAAVGPAEFVSACEWQAREIVAAVMQHLPFRDDFRWAGRDPLAYKESSTLPFRDVTRVELIGKTGEATAFDLRYFQIEPGGFTSLEKHAHTHTVIGVRGEGILRNGDKQFSLKELDVAYVPPLAVHQLRNETSQPFGFFCIVDRNRDRPQPV